MPITLQQLRNLVAVVEAGSFRAAAERTNGQQSSISRSIQDLESGLGAELFDRLPSGARLTDIGEQLLPDIISIIDGIEGLVAKAKARSAVRPDRFTLGVDATLAPTQIQHVLSIFRDLNASLPITLKQCWACEVVSGVKDGQIQLGIIRDRELPASLSYRRFLVGQLLAICPDDWRIDGDELDIAFLKEQSLHVASSDIGPDGIARLRLALGSEINITAHNCGAGGLVSLVASGLGVGLISTMPVEAATLPLKVLPLNPTIPVVGLTALWSRDVSLPHVPRVLDQIVAKSGAGMAHYSSELDGAATARPSADAS